MVLVRCHCSEPSAHDHARRYSVEVKGLAGGRVQASAPASPFTIHHLPFLFTTRWRLRGARITLDRHGQGGPTTGGMPCRMSSRSNSPGTRCERSVPSRRQPAGAQHNPPCAGRKLARHCRRTHPRHPTPGAPFAALLRGVTSKHRGHRGQLAETGLSPCPDSFFLSPVGPGTSPRTPGTPGTTHSSKVHGSASNRPRPLCLVLGARSGGHVQREASPRHRRPSAARNPWAMGQGQPRRGQPRKAHTSRSKMAGAMR